MYRGFNLQLVAPFQLDAGVMNGASLHNKNRNYIRQTLGNFISPTGAVDGSKLREYWFPLLEADVFISHAHTDTKQAIALSGWLSEMGVTSFVDSSVWGYAADLQKLIDNDHCRNAGGYHYDYDLRNLSTAHVHMMLATALSMMIDRTECIIFLNTPRSISSSAAIDKTTSPWLYHELSITKVIEKRSPAQHRAKIEKGLFSLNEGRTFEYDVDLQHLEKVGASHLLRWQHEYNNDEFALDILYDMVKKKA